MIMIIRGDIRFDRIKFSVATTTKFLFFILFLCRDPAVENCARAAFNRSLICSHQTNNKQQTTNNKQQTTNNKKELLLTGCWDAHIKQINKQ